jgi:hypothetical protein
MKCKALPVLLPSHVEVKNIFLPLHHDSILLPKHHPPTSIDVQYSWYGFISHYSIYALSLERLLSMAVHFKVPLTITIIRNFSYWDRLKNSLLCLNPFCFDTAARPARSRYRYHVRAGYLRHGSATNILSQTHDPRSTMHRPRYRLSETLSLGGFCRWPGPKSGSSMVAVTISNRGYVKRDPPEPRFRL